MPSDDFIVTPWNVEGDIDYEKLIKRRTVEAYEVKKGEYIQIIDTAGRQCSDFLAFDKAKLDKRIESIIDATGTRTFMGSAYPGPGLFSKFLDCLLYTSPSPRDQRGSRSEGGA